MTRLNAEESNVTSSIDHGPPVGFGHGVHVNLHQHVALADAKAGALVAADLGFAVILFSNQPRTDMGTIVYWGAALLFTVSALVGASALYPRSSKNDLSLIFWQGISQQKTSDDYWSAVSNLDERKVKQEYAEGNYHVSRILCAKYSIIRWCASLFILRVLVAFAGTALG